MVYRLLALSMLSGLLALQVAGAAVPRALQDSRDDSAFAMLRHTAFRARDGVPGDIKAMAETPDGFIWLGTPSGLFRYDGARFTQPFDALLASPSINALLADSNGDLWVGYLFGGVGWLHGGRITNYPTAQLPGGTIRQIVRTPTGTVWASSNRGLAKFDGRAWTDVGDTMGYSGEMPYWLGWNGDSLVVLTATQALFLPRGAPRFIRGDRQAAERIRTGVPAPYAWHPETRQNQPNYIFVDSTHAIWVVADNVLRRYRWPPGADRPIVDEFTAADGLTGQVFSLLEDREGNIWAGTTRGLDRFGPARLHQVPLPEPSLDPLLIPTRDGEPWIGGQVGGVLRLGTHPAVTQDLGRNIMTATRARDGSLWVAGSLGVLRYTPEGVVEKAPPMLEAADLQATLDINGWQSIAEDGNGVIWLSVVRYGLFCLKDGVWMRPSADLGLPPGPAVRLLADERKRLWLAYPDNEIVVLEDGRAKVYTATDGLAVGNVIALEVHGEHVWAAGDMGVATLVDGRFVAVRGKGGELFRNASGMVETPAGELWLNASEGLFRIPHDSVVGILSGTAAAIDFELFDWHDGLDGSLPALRPGPTLLQTSDGHLWLSRYEAVWWLDPSHIERNRVPPTVSIDTVTRNGVTYPASTLEPLSRSNSHLRIDYTAASFTSPERVRFRYQLVGMDETWQDAGSRRQAFYTNLGPGQYRFLVRAANEDGVWSQTAVWRFSIPPAFYETAWFRLLCLGFLLVLAWLLLLLRLDQVKGRIRQRLNERHAERERIARDLHDTLLQGIQALLFRLQLWASDTDIPDGRRNEIAAVVIQARAIVVEGRERILTLRGVVPECQDLVDSLAELGGKESAGQTARFEITASGQRRRLFAEACQQLIDIAREALRNAHCHARASLVALTVDYQDTSLRLRIADDGRGIDPQILAAGERSGHFGLVGMRERAAELGARFCVESDGALGTRITVTVPGGVVFENYWRWPWQRKRSDR
jgi:signal transduction histidine kinase/ligand-binding sensor domain-containing protein